MLPLKLQNMLQYMRDKGYTPLTQPETQQSYVLLTLSGREYPLFIKVAPPGDSLQLLLFIPCLAKPEGVPHLARMLHFLNRELDLPGFCMEESSGAIFFRCVLLSTTGQIDETLIDSLLSSMPRIADYLTGPIALVANGKSYEFALPHAKMLLKKLTEVSERK
jgi:hypothetical protein